MILAAMLLYLTAHFTAVLIYAAPNDNENKLKRCITLYIYPYYHQHWGMFVPVPKQNFRIFMKDDQHDWEDVFSEVLDVHQRCRLGGGENAFLSMGSAIRYYASSSEPANFLKSNNGSNMDLRVLNQVLVGYWQSKYKERPKHMQLIIMITDAQTGISYAHYYKD
jgi:hypothetical protein